MEAKKGDLPIDLSTLISKFQALSAEEKLNFLVSLVESIKNQHPLGKGEAVPIGAFSSTLGSLETIVKYMHENLNLRFVKIAELLGRSSKTIWATYHKACKKMPSPFSISDFSIMVPVSVFADRKYSILESLVSHLKSLELQNHKIALLIKRDDSTVWAVYEKAKRKRGMADAE